MAFLSLFGITVPARKNSWPGRPVFVGDELGRGAAGVLEDHFVRRVREWSGVKLVFQEPETGHALRRLLEGEFIHFDFDADMLAHNGEGPASGGGYTRSNTGGKHTGKVAVSSGSYLALDLARALGVEGGWEPTQGWTLIVWKKLTTTDDGVGGTGTYYHHIATGDVAVTQGASANPASVTQYRDGVAGSFSMGNWIDVTAAGVVRLHGKDGDASNNAKDYDDLVVLPFKLPAARAATWAAELHAWMDEHAFGDAPRLMIGGDCIPDLLPLSVRCTVTSEQNVNVKLAGVHYNNALELECSFRETDPLTPREPVGPSLEDLILADPDLLIYYPLDDASNPGTVVDLAGGYDLTVYDTDGVFTWGATGPTAEVPLWPTGDFDISDVSYQNYLARAENVGPTFPQGDFTCSMIIKGAPAYGTYLDPFTVYGWSGGAGGAYTGISMSYYPAGATLLVYINSFNHSFTSIPALTTERLITIVLNLAVGTYGTLYLYIDGVLHQSAAITAPGYTPAPPTRKMGIVLYQSCAPAYESPPTPTTYAYALDGSMAHWLLSGRAYDAAEVLALGQAAGFA